MSIISVEFQRQLYLTTYSAYWTFVSLRCPEQVTVNNIFFIHIFFSDIFFSCFMYHIHVLVLCTYTTNTKLHRIHSFDWEIAYSVAHHIFWMNFSVRSLAIQKKKKHDSIERWCVHDILSLSTRKFTRRMGGGIEKCVQECWIKTFRQWDARNEMEILLIRNIFMRREEKNRWHHFPSTTIV